MKLVCLWHGQEHEHERKFGAQNVMAKTKRNQKKKRKCMRKIAKYKMENRKEIKHKQRHLRDASMDATAPHTRYPTLVSSLPFTPCCLPLAITSGKNEVWGRLSPDIFSFSCCCCCCCCSCCLSLPLMSATYKIQNVSDKRQQRGGSAQ